MSLPLVIIQARMSSERCPGKVLRQVSEKPMLQYLIERIAKSRHSFELVVATSVDKSDNPVEDFCSKQKVSVVRGPLEDVAARFSLVLNKYSAEFFVRLNGDSPMLDAEILDRAIECFQKERCDIATNTFERSFPKGESVEVLRAQLFLDEEPKMKNDEREHITQYFYRRPSEFRISSFKTADMIDYSKQNLSVDTEKDFAVFSKMAEAFGAKLEAAPWKEMLRMQAECQEILQS